MHIEQNAKREMQRTVTHSKLNIKKTVGRKCLYLLHKLYDNRNKLHFVQNSNESWLLWDFDCLQAPKFEDDHLKLANSFPIYCNVYQVCVHRSSTQIFLKCDCLLYDRCGYPCSHILRITNKVDDTMVKVQHWKIFSAYYGGENVRLSQKIMELVALQKSYEGCGMPITPSTFDDCVQQPKTGWVPRMSVTSSVLTPQWSNCTLF